MRGKKFSKLMAVLLIIILAVSACGSSGGTSTEMTDAAGGNSTATTGESGPTGITDDKVTLRFSWWGSEDRHEAMQKVVDLYTTENPNVTIDVEYGPWEGWQTKVLTQLSGKTEPDIMQVNYNWIHSFGKGSNVFYDLNELSDYIDLSNWSESDLSAMTVNGQLGAVPHGMTGRAFVYSKALFEEFSVEYPSTYDQIIEAAGIIGADNTAAGADNKYVLLTIGEQATDLFIAQMLYNKTGKIMQEDGQINYTEEEVAEILELYKSLEDSGAMPTYQQSDPIQNESNPVWTNGRAGSVYEWVGTMNKYLSSYKAGEATDEIGVAPYVTFNEGDKSTIYVKPNLGYAVSKSSKNPEAAADFINFMFTNEEAVKALGTSLGISNNTATRNIQESESMLDGGMKEGYEVLESYEQVIMDPYFEDENVRGVRYTAIEAFRTGSLTAGEAAADYINNQQAELNKLFK